MSVKKWLAPHKIQDDEAIKRHVINRRADAKLSIVTDGFCHILGDRLTDVRKSLLRRTLILKDIPGLTALHLDYTQYQNRLFSFNYDLRVTVETEAHIESSGEGIRFLPASDCSKEDLDASHASNSSKEDLDTSNASDSSREVFDTACTSDSFKEDNDASASDTPLIFQAKIRKSTKKTPTAYWVDVSSESNAASAINDRLLQDNPSAIKDRLLQTLHDDLIIKRLVDLDILEGTLSYLPKEKTWRFRFRTMVGSSTWIAIPPIMQLVKPTDKEYAQMVELCQLVLGVVESSSFSDY